jgi:hypothetical protein
VRPKILTADAAITLRRSDGTEDPRMIALSLYPKQESDELSIKRTLSSGIRLGPNLSLTPDAVPGQQGKPLIQGFGELTSNFAWRLHDRPGQPILGAYRLAAVIQLPHGVSAQARISLAAEQGGAIRRKFQSEEILVPITAATQAD